MFLYMKDIVKGMRRRKKELLLIVMVEFAAVLFVMVALLFQHNAKRYTLEANRYVYGDWTVAEVITDAVRQSQQLAKHPYFDGYGTAVSGLPLIDAEGKEYSYSVGWVDDTMLEIGHIALREGRFPENDKEIVVETGVLAALGFPFETGQKITLFLPEDAFYNGRCESFEVVGILQGSLSYWDVGAYMPQLLVTKEALENVWFRPETTYCYYLKEQYAKADVAELYQNLDELHLESKRTGWQLIYNSSRYTVSYWDGTELYTSVEQMVLLMGMAVMSFLLAAYIQKRKKYYYNLRIIGMSKVRVRMVTLWELLCACLPGVVLGIPAGLLLGAVICGGLTIAKDMEWFYEVPAGLIGKAFLLWLLIFAVSALVSILITGNRRLYSSSRELSLRHLPRWCLNKLRHNRRYSSLFIREKRVYRLRNIMSSLLSVLFATLLMLCCMELWDTKEIYRRSIEYYPDFRYYRYSEEYKDEGEYVWEKPGSKTWTKYSHGDLWLSEGFSDGFFPLLDEISGITEYTYGTKDNAHLFEWEDMQEDPYILKIRSEIISASYRTDGAGNRITVPDYMGEVLPENSLYFGYNSWFTTEEEHVFELYRKAWENGNMNYDAFTAGEQVFLICNEPELTIQAGDSLWIVAGEQKVEVEVAAVIPQVEVTEEYYPAGTTSLAVNAAMHNSVERLINKNLYLVGSEQLARTIAKAEGTEFRYNWIDIELNPLAQYDLTVKQCVKLLASEGARGNSYYEFLQQKKAEFVNGILLYGMFFVMLVAFFLVLRANIIQSGFTFQGDRMKRLRMLGMELRQLRNMNLLQGLYEARWTWLAVPIVYAVKIRQYVRELTPEDASVTIGVFLEETGTMTSDVREILKYRWDEQVELPLCLAVLVVVLVLHVLTRYLVSRGAIAALDNREQEV